MKPANGEAAAVMLYAVLSISATPQDAPVMRSIAALEAALSAPSVPSGAKHRRYDAWREKTLQPNEAVEKAICHYSWEAV